MAFPENFLWGGALAAHQFEGGVIGTSKGLSVADVMTAGSHGCTSSDHGWSCGR